VLMVVVSYSRIVVVIVFFTMPDRIIVRLCVGPFVKSEEAEVKWVQLADDTVELSVSDLSPATNYTLLVYAANSYGRSHAAFIVYASTGGTKSRFFSSTPDNRIRFDMKN